MENDSHQVKIQQKQEKLLEEKISFSEFRNYSIKYSAALNALSESGAEGVSYKSSYRVLDKMFAKEHDCEFLQIQCQIKSNTLFKASNNKAQNRQVIIKMNITYSLAYQIPLFLFMPYHLIGDSKTQSQTQELQEEQDLQIVPFKKQEVGQILNRDIVKERLNPSDQESGVFVVQNHINKEYFYSLHNCQMGAQGLKMNQILPFYLSIVGLHPHVSFD